MSNNVGVVNRLLNFGCWVVEPRLLLSILPVLLETSQKPCKKVAHVVAVYHWSRILESGQAGIVHVDCQITFCRNNLAILEFAS